MIQSLAEFPAEKKVAFSGRHKILIQERDIRFCLWLCECGVLRTDQAFRAIWHNSGIKGPRYAKRRIAALEKFGYIRTFRTPYSRAKYVVATKLGHELAVRSGAKNIPYGPILNAEILHAHGLVEIRLAIQEAGKMASWQSDRSLLIDPTFPKIRFATFIPDAIWISNTGNRIFVEYERTRKALIRTRQKIEFYACELDRGDRMGDFVLWITEPSSHSAVENELIPYPSESQRIRLLSDFLKEIKKEVAH